MDKIKILMEIYQGLWISPDFDFDLSMNFPSQYHALKYNENKISADDLNTMYIFLKNHPIFN